MSRNPAVWVSDARHYVSEVQAEYKKITWPPRKEAYVGTAAVIVIIAVVTVVLGMADFILSRLVQLVIQ